MSGSQSPPQNNDEQLEAVFLQMQAEFFATLSEKLSKLDQLVVSALKDPSNPSLLVEAGRELHRLKGTIGSYGFIELSRLLGDVEKAVRSISEQPKPELAQIESEINEKMEKAKMLACQSS